MDTTKTIIIEDEPLAREHLRRLASKNAALHVVGVYESPDQITDLAVLRAVDLILSDIQMPNIDGLSFLKSLDSPPLFVFITAHPEYAIEGFDLDVVDYILKPTLTEARLAKAVEKARSTLSYQKAGTKQELLRFKDGPRTVFLHPDDVLYIKALGDYVKITTREETITVKMTLKELENILPANLFIRIHRSHIVSMAQIKAVDAVRVKLKNGDKLDIGLTYREQLYVRLGMKPD